MGTITYTPTVGLIQAQPTISANANIFEKVAYGIYSFIEHCRAFGRAWSSFWSDPLGNTLHFVIDGIDILATFLVANGEIFVIVGIFGMYMVIAGYEEKGKKVTGGAVIGYLVAKVVSEWL